VNQAIIVVICLALSIIWRITPFAVLVFFAMMQLGALLGSMWTSRLVGKFDRARRDKIDLVL
jgi:hypothetical protein